MTYVDDPSPYWEDEDEYGPIEGNYVERSAPARLVLDAWGRTPAQSASAESQAKAAASREASMAEFARVNGREEQFAWNAATLAGNGFTPLHGSLREPRLIPVMRRPERGPEGGNYTEKCSLINAPSTSA